MTSKIRTLIGAIETRLNALGFVAVDTVFDFDAVPESLINKAYRIESRLREPGYGMNNLANPREEITVWVSYSARPEPRTAWKNALDDRERIEDDLVNDPTIMALDSDPLIVLDGEASAQRYLKEYLISKLAFTADYLRTIA